MMPFSIGPRQITGWCSSISNPIETMATPQLSIGTIRCVSPLPRTSGVRSATPSIVGAFGP